MTLSRSRFRHFHSATLPPPNLEPEVNNRNRVFYASVQSSPAAGTTSFFAASPANSRHAAQLAEIALAVQERKTPLETPTSSNRDYLSGRPSRDPRTRDRGTPDVPDYFATRPNHHPRDSQSYSQPYQIGGVTYHQLPDGTLIPVSARQDQGQEVYYYPPSNGTTDGVGTPAVTRHQTPHRTTYDYKNASTGGRMQVSAPVGSSEAQMFDAFAAANSGSSSTTFNSSRYESNFVRPPAGDDSKRRGWFWKS
ncbi:hypothetical protein B0T21DRAFT_48640 [Apiosordaria backusii]|uniref:Uncharacterized protein n=1 Tax=Apiosordaria backusii TaxID=314023 RepID=A0AA40ASH2_9PEZI|nr:hypothetical protein B0T21DRAFT_48640 [Apiosordaria backusii]